MLESCIVLYILWSAWAGPCVPDFSGNKTLYQHCGENLKNKIKNKLFCKIMHQFCCFFFVVSAFCKKSWKGIIKTSILSTQQPDVGQNIQKSLAQVRNSHLRQIHSSKRRFTWWRFMAVTEVHNFNQHICLTFDVIIYSSKHLSTIPCYVRIE